MEDETGRESYASESSCAPPNPKLKGQPRPTRNAGMLKSRELVKYKFNRGQIRRKQQFRAVCLIFPATVPLTDTELNALFSNLGEDLKSVFPEMDERR